MTEENIEEAQDVEIDVTEFSLDEEEINELIEKLQKLKQTKDKINFEVDDENEFVIYYEEEGE